jgi:hypothetical protein
MASAWADTAREEAVPEHEFGTAAKVYRSIAPLSRHFFRPSGTDLQAG